MNDSVLPVTVVIPVRNEARHLPLCLASLKGAFAEVLVVDSDSTDETPAIALAAGCKLIRFEWDGRFPKKRNWVLDTFSFKTPWVLFLDADERVTPGFLCALRSVIPQTAHAGFWIRFDNWFMGKRLRYGDVFTKLALFRVGSGAYERFPEDHWSALDMEVHEHPVLDGTTGVIRERLEHRDERSPDEFLRKHDAYAAWEVKRYCWLQTAGSQAWEPLTRRQRFKYRNLDCWWLCWFYFTTCYLLKRGFLDGMAGFRYAWSKCIYFRDIRRRLRKRGR